MSLTGSSRKGRYYEKLHYLYLQKCILVCCKFIWATSSAPLCATSLFHSIEMVHTKSNKDIKKMCFYGWFLLFFHASELWQLFQQNQWTFCSNLNLNNLKSFFSKMIYQMQKWKLSSDWPYNFTVTHYYHILKYDTLCSFLIDMINCQYLSIIIRQNA